MWSHVNNLQYVTCLVFTTVRYKSLGWIPRLSKNFLLNLKFPFVSKNIKNEIQGEFTDFYEFTLYLNCSNSSKCPFEMAFQGWRRKNPRVYHFWDFPSKMTIWENYNGKIKMENFWKFSDYTRRLKSNGVTQWSFINVITVHVTWHVTTTVRY